MLADPYSVSMFGSHTNCVMTIIFQVISSDTERHKSGGKEGLGLEAPINEGTQATSCCNSSQLISLICTLQIIPLFLSIYLDSNFDYLFKMFLFFIYN